MRRRFFATILAVALAWPAVASAQLVAEPWDETRVQMGLDLPAPEEAGLVRWPGHQLLWLAGWAFDCAVTPPELSLWEWRADYPYGGGWVWRPDVVIVLGLPRPDVTSVFDRPGCRVGTTSGFLIVLTAPLAAGPHVLRLMAATRPYWDATGYHDAGRVFVYRTVLVRR